jgi:hypothetical protein
LSGGENILRPLDINAKVGVEREGMAIGCADEGNAVEDCQWEGGDGGGGPRGSECGGHGSRGCDVRLDEVDIVLADFGACRWPEVEDADGRGGLAAEEELLHYPASYEAWVGGCLLVDWYRWGDECPWHVIRRPAKWGIENGSNCKRGHT